MLLRSLSSSLQLLLTIKYRILGHQRLLMRGLSGARVEIGLATFRNDLVPARYAAPDLLNDSSNRKGR
jgi:hypothetical protein